QQFKTNPQQKIAQTLQHYSARRASRELLELFLEAVLHLRYLFISPTTESPFFLLKRA
ncbi:hypothetical protein ACJX0J_027769, partial [Zea mays]